MSFLGGLRDKFNDYSQKIKTYSESSDYKNLKNKLKQGCQDVSTFSRGVFEGAEKKFHQAREIADHSFQQVKDFSSDVWQGAKAANAAFEGTILEDSANEAKNPNRAFRMGEKIMSWGNEKWQSTKNLADSTWKEMKTEAGNFAEGVKNSGKKQESGNLTTAYKLGDVFTQAAKKTYASTEILAQKAWQATGLSQTPSLNKTPSKLLKDASMQAPLSAEGFGLGIESRSLAQEYLQNQIAELNRGIDSTQDQLHLHAKELGLAWGIDSQSFAYQDGPPRLEDYIRTNPDLQNHPELMPHLKAGFDGPMNNTEADAAFYKETFLKDHSGFKEHLGQDGYVTKEASLAAQRTCQENLHGDLTKLEQQEGQLHHLHQLHDGNSIFQATGDLLGDLVLAGISIGARALAVNLTREAVNSWMDSYGGADKNLSEAKEADKGWLSKVKNTLTNPKVVKTVSCVAIGTALLCGGWAVTLGASVACAGVEQLAKHLRPKEKRLADQMNRTGFEKKVDDFCKNHPILAIAGPFVISVAASPIAGLAVSSALSITQA